MNNNLIDLIKRKQKADAMPDIRKRYGKLYDSICADMVAVMYGDYYEDEIGACIDFFKKYIPDALCGTLTGDGYCDFCEAYLQLNEGFRTKLASHFLCFIVAELDSINKCATKREDQ